MKNLKDSIVAANINVTVAEKQIMDAVNKSMHIKERIQIVHINQTRILNDLKKDVLDVIQEIQVRLPAPCPGQRGMGTFLAFFLEKMEETQFLRPSIFPGQRKGMSFKRSSWKNGGVMVLRPSIFPGQRSGMNFKPSSWTNGGVIVLRPSMFPGQRKVMSFRRSSWTKE